MKKNIAKLYNQFSGLERLRLVIEAQARGDEGECVNLVRSCPKEHFSISEDAYTTPLKATLELVKATCADFALYMGRLEALDVVRLILLGLIKVFSGLETISQKRREDIVGTLKAVFFSRLFPYA